MRVSFLLLEAGFLHAAALRYLGPASHTYDQVSSSAAQLSNASVSAEAYTSDSDYLQDAKYSMAVKGMAFVAFVALLVALKLTKKPPEEDDANFAAEAPWEDMLMKAHGVNSMTSNLWQDPFKLSDFSTEALQQNMPRLSVSVLVWCLALYTNNIAQAWLQKHMAGFYEFKTATARAVPLWDMGYNVFPAINSMFYAEAFARAIPVMVMLRFVGIPGPLSMRWTILSRMLLLWGILWAIRAVMIVATVLPDPDKHCRPTVAFPENIYMEAAANMPFVFWHSETTCQDVFFSGHTVALTLFTCFYTRYIDWAPWLTESCKVSALSLKSIALVLMSIGCYCIIACKLHYSIDVLAASLMTGLVFHAYHYAMHVAHLSPLNRSLLQNCYLSQFIRWFEQDAIDVVILQGQLHGELQPMLRKQEVRTQDCEKYKAQFSSDQHSGESSTKHEISKPADAAPLILEPQSVAQA